MTISSEIYCDPTECETAYSNVKPPELGGCLIPKDLVSENFVNSVKQISIKYITSFYGDIMFQRGWTQ